MSGSDDEDAKATGEAMVIVLLLLALRSGRQSFIPAALVLLILSMTAPALFRPFARVWFRVAHEIGSLSSKSVLVLVFYAVVTPVGVVRRLLGADPLRTRHYRGGDTSAMLIRRRRVEPADLTEPY